MLIADVGFALLIAALLSLIFVRTLRAGGPWPGYFSLFLIIFLAAWAAALWIKPTGPLWWGVSWIPILVVGILVALLPAAVTYSAEKEQSTTHHPDTNKAARREAAALVALGTFSWALIVGLLVVIILGHVF